MNTKRMMRWGIVLFLFAALPVMTAVMAQEEEPAMQLPVVREISESQEAFEFNKYEEEPNEDWLNNLETQTNDIAVSDVMAGTIGSVGDVDFFIYEPVFREISHFVLIDIDAQTIGSALDPVVCFYDLQVSSSQPPDPVACSNNTDSLDPLLFYAVPSYEGNDFFAISVSDYGNNSGGSNHYYELLFSSPLLVSAAPANLAAGGDVAGIHFYSEDILAYSRLFNDQYKWQMFFDGSDVEVKTVTNIAASGDGDDLLLSVGKNQTLPVVGAVTAWDMFVFDPVQYGPHTMGTFRWGLKGAEHNLTTTGEKLDAIDGWVNGNDSCFGYPVSTAGIASVPSWNNHIVKQDNEDVFCKVYDGTWQPWRYFFDVKGKNNAPKWWASGPGRVPGLPAEDVIAMAYHEFDREMFLTIQGTGNIFGHTVDQKGIFTINYPEYTWGRIVWQGPDHGWNYNIDAIEFQSWWGY